MKSFFSSQLAITAFALLSGCAQQPSQIADMAGYCNTLHGFRTCITGPIPSMQTELQARQFSGRPDALTIYVVRHSLSDRPEHVTASIDDGHSVIMVPDSMVRIVAPAGEHELELHDHGPEQKLEVTGRKGDVEFVQIGFKYGLADYGYRLRIADKAEARQRAANSRLIADIEIL